MTAMLSIGENKRRISIRYLVLTVFACVSMMAWLGLSNLRADEDNPDKNRDQYKVGFENAAQARHAGNVARQAALQDPTVIELIELGRYRAARAVYHEKVETFTQQITSMRASGLGWGDIAHKYGVHPSVLGLGHSPKTFEERFHPSGRSGMKSKSKSEQRDADLAYANGRHKNRSNGLALGHGKDKSSDRGGGRGGGKGNGKK